MASATGYRHGVFDDFTLETIRVGDVTLRVRYGGSGSPVVLLHGHPRTHTTWHAVAPLLAVRHTVVCPDLRGYGSPPCRLTCPTTPSPPSAPWRGTSWR